MTLLIGILCTDGVVVAADSAVTFGSPGVFTITHVARKIDIVDGQLIVAGTGQLGLGQRFTAKVRELWLAKKLSGGDEFALATTVTEEVVRDFSRTQAPKGGFGALLAFPKKSSAHLCEFAVADLQPEMKTPKCWYVSLGSGQSLADPYLALFKKIFWSGGPPTVERGIFAAVWTMKHALEAAPGFVCPPIDVAVLRTTTKGTSAAMLSEDDLQEHHDLAKKADEHLASFFEAGKVREAGGAVPEPEAT